MRVLSDNNVNGDGGAYQGYRDQYGQMAFEEYMREESRRDEES